MVPALHYSWDLSLAMMFSDIKYQAIFGILSVIDAHYFSSMCQLVCRVEEEVQERRSPFLSIASSAYTNVVLRDRSDSPEDDEMRKRQYLNFEPPS